MSDTLARSVKVGGLAGLVMSFMGAIGMIEAFSRRTLIDPILGMDQIFLYAVPLIAGVLIGTRREEDDAPELRSRLNLGLTVGIVAGVITALFIWVVDTFDMSSTFPNMRPAMVDTMTSGMGTPAGYALVIVLTVLATLAGSALTALPENRRRAVTVGAAWVFGMALLQPVVSDIIDFSRWAVRFFYAAQGGLNLGVAIVVFLLAGWASLQYHGKPKAFIGKVQASELKSRLRLSVYGMLVVGVIILPMMLGGIVNELLINVSLFILMGLGLNIVVGLAGLLDLGYVAFFAVGAYGTAVLTSPLSPTWDFELTWWAALPVVFVLAAIAGVFVGTPVLRMRGDYLAIVTLGFGEIVRILLLSDWLTPYFGGAQGVRRIPGIPVGDVSVSAVQPQLFIYITVVFVLIAAYVSHRAMNSRVGRAWAAMREDEDVAEAIGVSTVQSKLLAFVSGAMIASIAGALFSAKVGTVFTNSFDVLVSIVILVVVIVGGMGRIGGVVVGALVLIGILGGPKSPGLLVEFAEFKLLIYGAILVFMMLSKPEGLLPSVRRSRELHQEEFMQDAWLDKDEGGAEAKVAGEV